MKKPKAEKKEAPKAAQKEVKKDVKKEEPASASKGAAVAIKREKKVFELPGR